MPIKLYLDQDSGNRAVLSALRAAGLDVLTTGEAGRSSASDEEQLELSTAQGRVIYTANCGDFAKLHRDWLRSGRHHSGMILRANQQASTGDQVRGLLRVTEAFASAGTRDLFTYLAIWLRTTSSVPR